MENDFEEILEPGRDCCIYRVPQFLRNINEEAYAPQLISIGPLNYGKKELMGMENQKRRYWSKFGERVNAEKLNEFETYVKGQEQCIRDHYSVTSMLQSSEYVRMVLYDAIFIIELLLRNYEKTDDFLLKSPRAVYITRDLLLLENQLPFFVLNNLYTKAFPKHDRSFIYLFFEYLCGSNAVFYFEEHFLRVKHFIDFHRFILLGSKPPTVGSDETGTYVPCATKLNKSRLKFRGINGKSWLDISLETRKRYGRWFPWFEVNELQIPTIIIDDNTECLLRNLIAFEMFHYPTKTHICHYVFLMDQLIETEKDVDLLVEKGVIINYVGNNEAIAKIFNKICSHIVLSEDSCYNDINKKIKAHYRYSRNHAKATQRHCNFTLNTICLSREAPWTKNPQNKREIICDEKLKAIFDGK